MKDVIDRIEIGQIFVPELLSLLLSDSLPDLLGAVPGTVQEDHRQVLKVLVNVELLGKL